MKLKFKKQAYQTNAVEAVADCFAGQPKREGLNYRMDPGRAVDASGHLVSALVAAGFTETAGFKNADLALTPGQMLENIHAVQRRQNLPLSAALVKTKVCDINLDVEMETGTGKTYCYVKSMFELNARYGWSKFIVVVPSIAIREGVFKSLEITAEHFLDEYKKRARFFIYNSKQLHNLESFSSDAGINVMVINVQAFNATGKDARRIYEELDDFQSRRPIDVISANRPILFLDEPQKMEGGKTLDSLANFKPLAVLRYSATHKTAHNKIHRLDALDAYNQKLVKKIAVRGISVKGLTGTNAYLYLESIEVSTAAPVARVELEIKQNNGIKRVLRKLSRNDNLFDLSGDLEQYRGFVVADINALTNTVSFTNGHELVAGEATGDVSESALRRIQIREAVKAHFEKEQALFTQGIKVLSLFFIDAVSKYRSYDDAGEQPGEYAQMFEEEYNQQLAEVQTLDDTPYNRYLKGIATTQTHNGYFSIDKKTKRMVDPETGKKSTEADDVDAYDLILKDKERLLSFDEPVRFIFSHSALREGWDNPNVFVICTLKHSDNTVSRRQEVGRGLRLSVNQHGDRMDNAATVHQINVLTVVASESYKDFVTALQRDISEGLSERPREANESYFTGKVLKTTAGDVDVTPHWPSRYTSTCLKTTTPTTKTASPMRTMKPRKRARLQRCRPSWRRMPMPCLH
jgi:type III restriction enzyme